MALANLDEIYRDDAILDHRRNPRNPARLADADIIADGVNPFCGDEIHLQIRLDAGGRAVAIGFQGEGCSINQAAGSMLSEAVKGRTPPEMLALADEFRRMLQSPNPPARRNAEIAGRRPGKPIQSARVPGENQMRPAGVVDAGGWGGGDVIRPPQNRLRTSPPSYKLPATFGEIPSNQARLRT